MAHMREMNPGSYTVSPLTVIAHREVDALVTECHPEGRVGGKKASLELARFPSRGFQLRQEGQLVGVYLASLGGTPAGRTSCNLGLWCVRPHARSKALTLLHRVLRQSSDVVTDFTPTPEVAQLNQRLGFTDLDTTAFQVLNVRTPPAGRGVSVLHRPHEIGSVLTGFDAQAFRDHRDIPGLIHIVARVDELPCYVVAVRHRRSMEVIYVSDRALMHRAWPSIASHFLVRHRRLITRAETRVFGPQPSLARRAVAARRQIRAPESANHDVTYLYSLVALSGVVS